MHIHNKFPDDQSLHPRSGSAAESKEFQDNQGYYRETENHCSRPWAQPRWVSDTTYPSQVAGPRSRSHFLEGQKLKVGVWRHTQPLLTSSCHPSPLFKHFIILEEVKLLRRNIHHRVQTQAGTEYSRAPETPATQEAATTSSTFSKS